MSSTHRAPRHRKRSPGPAGAARPVFLGDDLPPLPRRDGARRATVSWSASPTPAPITTRGSPPTEPRSTARPRWLAARTAWSRRRSWSRTRWFRHGIGRALFVGAGSRRAGVRRRRGHGVGAGRQRAGAAVSAVDGAGHTHDVHRRRRVGDLAPVGTRPGACIDPTTHLQGDGLMKQTNRCSPNCAPSLPSTSARSGRCGPWPLTSTASGFGPARCSPAKAPNPESSSPCSPVRSRPAGVGRVGRRWRRRSDRWTGLVDRRPHDATWEAMTDLEVLVVNGPAYRWVWPCDGANGSGWAADLPAGPARYPLDGVREYKVRAGKGNFAR